MHYDLLNNSDIHILECRRIERFRTLFLEIVGLDYNNAILSLTLDNSLIISCGRKVSARRMNVKEVYISAQYVLGISKMSVYHGTQLVYEYNKLKEINNERTMTVAKEYGDKKMRQASHPDLSATSNNIENKQSEFFHAQPPTEKYTVERETIEESNKVTSKITKSLALADIAADLDASFEDIHSFLMEHDGSLIDFKGMIIVPESTAAIAYEHYSLVRARQKMQERFTSNNGFDSDKSTRVESQKSKTKSKKPTLTFKREFKIHGRNYKRTMENFLNAMFPSATTEQKQALHDIVQQSETGIAYLDKILRVGDYPDKQHARDLLYKAAAELSKSEIDNEVAAPLDEVASMDQPQD